MAGAAGIAGTGGGGAGTRTSKAMVPMWMEGEAAAVRKGGLASGSPDTASLADEIDGGADLTPVEESESISGDASDRSDPVDRTALRAGTEIARSSIAFGAAAALALTDVVGASWDMTDVALCSFGDDSEPAAWAVIADWCATMARLLTTGVGFTSALSPAGFPKIGAGRTVAAGAMVAVSGVIRGGCVSASRGAAGATVRAFGDVALTAGGATVSLISNGVTEAVAPGR